MSQLWKKNLPASSVMWSPAETMMTSGLAQPTPGRADSLDGIRKTSSPPCRHSNCDPPPFRSSVSGCPMRNRPRIFPLPPDRGCNPNAPFAGGPAKLAATTGGRLGLGGGGTRDSQVESAGSGAYNADSQASRPGCAVAVVWFMMLRGTPTHRVETVGSGSARFLAYCSGPIAVDECGAAQ